MKEIEIANFNFMTSSQNKIWWSKNEVKKCYLKKKKKKNAIYLGVRV